MVIGLIVLVVLIVAITVGITRTWNKGMNSRQAGAEAQRARNGGKIVLEWTGPKAQGAADQEFGELLVEIPKKSGAVRVQFYREGFVVNGKRTSYENLKDVVFIPGNPGAVSITPKQRMRNSAVLWLYRKKGSTIGIRDLSYRFDYDTMEAIQTGLGFRPIAS